MRNRGKGRENQDLTCKYVFVFVRCLAVCDFYCRVWSKTVHYIESQNSTSEVPIFFQRVQYMLQIPLMAGHACAMLVQFLSLYKQITPSPPNKIWKIWHILWENIWDGWIILQIHTPLMTGILNKVKGHILQPSRLRPERFFPLSVALLTSLPDSYVTISGCWVTQRMYYTLIPQNSPTSHNWNLGDVICQAKEMLIEFRWMKTHFPTFPESLYT